MQNMFKNSTQSGHSRSCHGWHLLYSWNVSNQLFLNPAIAFVMPSSNHNQSKIPDLLRFPCAFFKVEVPRDHSTGIVGSIFTRKKRNGLDSVRFMCPSNFEWRPIAIARQLATRHGQSFAKQFGPADALLHPQVTSLTLFTVKVLNIFLDFWSKLRNAQLNLTNFSVFLFWLSKIVRPWINIQSYWKIKSDIVTIKFNTLWGKK